MDHDTSIFSWVLPLAKTPGETDTPQQYLQKLSKAKDGFYPMGANSLWHGGIHLDNGTGLTPHSIIGCIAGGEVIAYRVDENYPTVTAELAESECVKPDIEPVYREETASYSSGFVLVRHRFNIPKLPPPVVAATQPETDPAAASGNTLTFYSLYMHLCDWAFYITEDKLPRPTYWGKPTVFEVGEKSKDRIKGCFVRIGGAHTTKLAILPRGTSIVIGEKHPDSIGKDDNKSWYKLDSLVSGEILNIQPNNNSVIGCYVFPGEMTKISGMQYRVAERGHDFDSTLLGHNIYSKPKTEPSALLSVLPRGAKIQIGQQAGRWGKIEKLLTGKAYPALPADAEGKIQGWIELPKLTPISTPQKTDDVVVLEAPYPVKTGELMSYPGIYQDLGNVQTPDDALRVHLEVFTSEDMPALIKRTTELAARQPMSEKTQLKVNQGALLYQPLNADKEIATETQLIKIDTPKAKGQWLEVQKVSMGVVDKKLLGSYTKISSHPIRGAYSVSITNKPSIAEALNVQTQDVPDTVFFRGECLNQNGKRLNTASPPATYPLREIYFPLANDSDSYWIDADKLDHEDRKTNSDRVIAAWSIFPLQEDNRQVGTVSFEQVFSRSEIEAGQHCHDHQGTLWWLLKTGKENSVIGTESFGEITGWIKDTSPGVTHHHPWEWPLFHTVQETATLAQTLERNQRQRLDPADRTLLMQKLYKILGATTQPVANSESSEQEDTALLKKENLQAALNVPWLAQQFSRLVVNYESEWFADENLGKWHEIDEMLKKYLCTPRASSETNTDYNQRIAIELKLWQAEKEQRIKKLLWWDKVAGKHEFPVDPKVWYLHPVGLIDNFWDHENDPKWLKVPRGQFTFDVEGNDMEDSRYFSRVPHWPEGASGITIGRGYDLGQRPNPESDLAGVGITGVFYDWLLGAKGLRGTRAQQYLNNASEEIRRTSITRKQQHKLFLLIYDLMKDQVVYLSNRESNIGSYGPLVWNNIDERIQDMVVDLIYRGDYNIDTRPYIQKEIVNNDIAAFRKAINNRAIWPTNLPNDRYQRRISYMR